MATETAAAPLSKLGVLKIRVDRVYGKVTIYPACERAKMLAAIAGTTTLTNATLGYAERMGFEIIESGTAAELLASRVWNEALVARRVSR